MSTVEYVLISDYEVELYDFECIDCGSKEDLTFVEDDCICIECLFENETEKMFGEE